MKLLNGRELAGFIKERQTHQVRSLRQSRNIFPKLAIVLTTDNPVIATYVRLKQAYGGDILIDTEVHRIEQADTYKTIQQLNSRDDVHGIIVQLPLADPSQTNEICDTVDPAKDVDALGTHAILDPATPTAILWLLAGYNIDLTGKNILLIGRGKLVGAPLERMLQASGHAVTVVDREVSNLSEYTFAADIIITATGSPAIIFPDMLQPGTVVVDAGVASEDGKTVGDLHPSVYERDDLILTPPKGGVGPLTVCALFENVIRAASNE